MVRSDQLMGAQKHKITYFARPTIIEENASSEENGSDSWLNKNFAEALHSTILVSRSWESKDTAGAAASYIRHGKIPGRYFGMRWQTLVVRDPRVEGESWTVKMRAL